ncbi:MAG: hypothetical protein Q8909_04435 [Bacteroidota bacterium]|nr:hypothetical protein [Bacteroidota bacterium]
MKTVADLFYGLHKSILLPGIRNGGLIESGFEAKAQNYANEAPTVCGHVEEQNVVLNSTTCYETYKHCYYTVDCTTGRVISSQGCQSMSRLNQACSRTANIADCNSVPGGFAYTDGCGQCVGGTTGRTSTCAQGAISQDCMEGVGGGSGTTPKPAVSVLEKDKWEYQEPGRCKDACDAYLRRTGLTNVSDRGCVFRLTYQDNGSNGASHFYGDPSTSLNTVVDVIDKHLDEGRGT